MINYELVKELKDAGFPQEFKQGRYFCSHMEQLDGKHDCDDIVYYPTLSELIEACEIFTLRFSLEQHSNDWRAGIYSGEKQFSVGKTPKEAVAKLYITLKKK